jgi:multiple sugar transport system permease protein
MQQPRSRLEHFLNHFEWGDLLMFIFLVMLVILIIFPFWWVVRTGFTDPNAVYSDASSLLPVQPTTFNFERVLGLVDQETLMEIIAGNPNISSGVINFGIFMRNSFIVAGLVTLGQCLFSSMSAYAFARFKFPGRDQIFFAYIMGLMIPGIVLFIPNYVMVVQWGWLDTFQGIVAPAFLMTPFAVFFMRQFYLSLNKDLEEAAMIDGATSFGIFWRIALPLIRGPLLTLALLTFIGSWNEYLWPLLVGKSEDVRVLTVALGVFKSQRPQGSPDWAGLMAGTLVSMIPTVFLFIFFGRKVVDSIQFSGFK